MAPEPPVAIVTGAGSGIGFACVQLLLARGYRVSAWDIKDGQLAGAAHERLEFVQLDVRDAAAMRDAAQKTGRTDALISAAAVFHARPFLEIDDTLWDQTFDVNLKGSLFAAQAVLPAMRRQRRGSIVFFSSILARSGAPRGAHYAATKGGVLGLVRTLALEVAGEGIRVNVVSPGVTDTPQPRGNMSEEELFSRAKSVPLARIGTPEEMAEAAMFLVSDDASFVTGQDLRLTGGTHLF